MTDQQMLDTDHPRVVQRMAAIRLLGYVEAALMAHGLFYDDPTTTWDHDVTIDHLCDDDTSELCDEGGCEFEELNLSDLLTILSVAVNALSKEDEEESWPDE